MTASNHTLDAMKVIAEWAQDDPEGAAAVAEYIKDLRGEAARSRRELKEYTKGSGR